MIKMKYFIMQSGKKNTALSFSFMTSEDFSLTRSQTALSSIYDQIKIQVGGIESVLIVQKFHHLV